MADSTEITILERVKTVLAGINGTGGYNYDLSATNQVVVGGRQEVPDLFPCAFVTWTGETVEHGPQLGRYKPTLSIVIAGVATHTEETPHSRTKAALNLALDFRKAIEADRTLNGNVLDLIVRAMDNLSDDDPDLPENFVAVQVTVEVYWHRSASS